MDRGWVYDACKVYIRPIDPMRESGHTKDLLTEEAVDAIIDCAVQEATDLIWKQLNDLAEKCESIRNGEVQDANT